MKSNFIRLFYALNSVPLNPGSGGHDIQTDLIAGKDVEVIKTAFGSEGVLTLVDAANPLPTTDNAVAVSTASIDLKTSDGSQKTQVVDGSGNVVGSTGNALDVNIKSGNVILNAQDIQIGAVELKNSTDDTRAVITAANALKVDGSAVTQPISAAALPLPTGAATAANQQTDALTNTQLRASAVPVSGTVTANTGLSQPLTDTQLRATPVPVSGTVTVDTSLLATSAKQDTQITAEQGIRAAVEIMDDWDESDRAKVNTIEGQAGVQAGAGAVSANTQRVVIATDQTAIPVTGSFALTNAALESGGNLEQAAADLDAMADNIDLIAQAMDKSNSAPIYTEDLAGALKRDANKALVLSDGISMTFSGATTSSPIFVLDTTGYNTAVMQMISSATSINIFGSNDGINWVQLNGYGNFSGVPVTSVSSTGFLYHFPTFTRYIRGVLGANSATTVAICLRTQSLNTVLLSTGYAPMNLVNISNTAAVSAGLAGTLAVGGNIAAGLAPTANPLIAGAIDTGGLTRRVLSDTSGRLIPSVPDQAGTYRALTTLFPGANQNNIASLPTTDQSQFEGQSIVELLGQILLELKINNQLLFELPATLQGERGSTNEPSEFRNDSTLFAV